MQKDKCFESEINLLRELQLSLERYTSYSWDIQEKSYNVWITNITTSLKYLESATMNIQVLPFETMS